MKKKYVFFFVIMIFICFKIFDINTYYIKARVYTLIKKSDFNSITSNYYNAELITETTQTQYKNSYIMRSVDKKSLYLIDIDSNEKELLLDSLQPLQSCYLINNYLFIETFGGLVQFDPANKTYKTIFYGPIYNLTYSDGYFYFMRFSERSNIYEFSLNDYNFTRLTRHLPLFHTSFTVDNRNLIYKSNNKFFVIDLDKRNTEPIDEITYNNLTKKK